MSLFQIPGLGQAKPNEVLPPLVTEAPVASAAPVDDELKDANPPPADTTPTASLSSLPATTSHAEQMKPSDSMEMDLSGSSPSLTGALEAALGGLDDVSTEEPAAAAAPEHEQPTLQPDESEHPEWEIDSSPYESSSESSSSDSSDEDSDNEGYELLGVEETARLLMELEGGSDDEGERGGKSSGSGYVRSKNELPEEIVPKPDLVITSEMKIEELGVIEHVVEKTILIKAFTPGEYQVLDAGSVLCTADRVVIGAIAETIGKVLQPMYTVMFNSEDELTQLGLEVGTKIFYPAEHVSFVFTEPLKSIKGSDASNLHDEEVGDEEMEFSDDEKEAEYKRSLKQKKKDKWKNGKEKDPHPLRQEMSASAEHGLNYDDDETKNNDDDGPYKPLARPAGYGTGPVSVESYDSRPPRSTHRGRGRDSRARGARGRGGGRGGRPPREGYSLPPQGDQFARQNIPPPPPPPLANFGFPLPSWPSPQAAPPPPPPPPGWPGSQGQQQGAFVNPAFFAALMSQMQQQTQGQQWQGQPPPPPGH